MQSGPITVQSIVRLVVLENVENSVRLIKSSKGEKFLSRWIKQLKADAIRYRKVKFEVGYVDQVEEVQEVLDDAV